MSNKLSFQMQHKYIHITKIFKLFTILNSKFNEIKYLITLQRKKKVTTEVDIR